MDLTLKHAVSEKNVDEHDRYNILDLNKIPWCKNFFSAEGGRCCAMFPLLEQSASSFLAMIKVSYM